MKRVAVMSGKGGVGKSTTAALVSLALSRRGRRVLLLDFDICGPSIVHLLGGRGKKVLKAERGLHPVQANERLWYISMASLVGEESSVVWRGPKKTSLLSLFYESIDGNAYDYVVIDMPPGISDEHRFLAGKGVSSLVVTTSQNLSLQEAEATIVFCRGHGIGVIGVLENMSCVECTHCHQTESIFSQGGGRLMAEATGVEYLGSLPIDPLVSDSTERGELAEDFGSFSLGALESAVDRVEEWCLFLEKSDP